MGYREYLLSEYFEETLKSITHPLTNELCQGTLPDFKLYTYLNQDLKFFEKSLTILEKTLAKCSNQESAKVFTKQTEFLKNDEKDYFTVTLTETLPEAQKKVPKMVAGNLVIKKVKEYLDYLDYLSKSSSYVELVTFIYVMEFVYHGWAEHNLESGKVPKGLKFKHAEWINLHSGENFNSWLTFLEEEMDRTTQDADDDDLDLCERTFVKTLQLEIDFFEACYKYRE